MYTGTVFGIALLVCGFLATLVALELLLGALFPRAVERGRAEIEARPVVSVLVGALPVLAVLAVSGVLSQLGGVGKFLGAIVSTLGVFVLGLGLASFARLVGERMPSQGVGAAPWRATLRGGITLAVAWALPLAGWFVLLPLTALAGIGGVTLASFRRKARAEGGDGAGPRPDSTSTTPARAAAAAPELVG